MDETDINPTISSFLMDEYDPMGMNFHEWIWTHQWMPMDEVLFKILSMDELCCGFGLTWTFNGWNAIQLDETNFGGWSWKVMDEFNILDVSSNITVGL